MNKAILIGNIGKGGVEGRFTPSGAYVASFSLATNRQYTSSSGEKVKNKVWFKVSAWGQLGEVANQYLKQGSKVMVEARIDAPYAYMKDDVAHASNQVTAENIEFLDSRPKNQEQPDAGDMLPPEDDVPF